MSLDIEGVLLAHEWQPTTEPYGWCKCDHSFNAHAHRAHVAAVLREQIDGALAEAKADGWDERDMARATYPDPHPEDCMGWEDCDCATYPNPYRAAHLSDTERAGDAG